MTVSSRHNVSTSVSQPLAEADLLTTTIFYNKIYHIPNFSLARDSGCFFQKSKSVLLPKQKYFFQQALFRWSAAHLRPLPWKNIKNPYFIWLSEIILQQTRVAQGLPYYLKFTENYPTVKALADAPEDDVMKCWEGLGYYSRARNLHSAAKYIAYDCQGIFPNTHEGILKIKGVGAYTAAAIASFAFDLPHAVVDGNVYRVLSRFFGISTPIDSTDGQKEFRLLADFLLEEAQPARYNQAIMDFGATHCLPKNPLCGTCPLHQQCQAFLQEKINILPVKSKKIVKKERFFNYFLFKKDGKTWIKKRIEKDIWQNLYELPLIESDYFLDAEKLYAALSHHFGGLQINEKSLKISKPYKHILTHLTIFAQFIEVELKESNELLETQFLEIFEYEIKKFAFSRLIDLYLLEKNVSLTLF
jgi:A/G-specific adenine glycosylase